MTTTRVTLTLEKSAAEKLRRICHLKGMTASSLISVWLTERDERGNLTTREAPSLFESIFGKSMFGK